MKLFRHNVMIVVMAAVAALFAGGCADDDGVDNRELDYGYVQFKLYKEASAPVSQPDAVSNDTRAVVEELDYLADACKIEIRLLSGSTTIAQTLTLNYADKESAEFGLRSDKLQLLAGEIRLSPSYSTMRATSRSIAVPPRTTRSRWLRAALPYRTSRRM